MIMLSNAKAKQSLKLHNLGHAFLQVFVMNLDKIQRIIQIDYNKQRLSFGYQLTLYITQTMQKALVSKKRHNNNCNYGAIFIRHISNWNSNLLFWQKGASQSMQNRS